MMKLFALLICLPSLLCAQDQPSVTEGEFTFDTDKPFSLLELDKKIDEPVVVPKKKPRRKVFFGIKTRKRFSSTGYGKKKIIELFYVLKKPQLPKGFARDYYWYDYKQRKIRKTTLKAFDQNKGALVHGPYKKMMGDQVLEEGIFFKGLKHGRWMRLSQENLLVDKEKYYKGWPKESLVTYYDPSNRKKIKEVTPIEHGEKEGNYYLLHDNGTIAVTGEYRWDNKVGDWKEYYTNGKRKKVIAYPKKPFDKKARPFVKREWDIKGKELFSRK